MPKSSYFCKDSRGNKTEIVLISLVTEFRNCESRFIVYPGLVAVIGQLEMRVLIRGNIIGQFAHKENTYIGIFFQVAL